MKDPLQHKLIQTQMQWILIFKFYELAYSTSSPATVSSVATSSAETTHTYSLPFIIFRKLVPIL